MKHNHIALPTLVFGSVIFATSLMSMPDQAYAAKMGVDEACDIALNKNTLAAFGALRRNYTRYELRNSACAALASTAVRRGANENGQDGGRGTETIVPVVPVSTGGGGGGGGGGGEDDDDDHHGGGGHGGGGHGGGGHGGGDDHDDHGGGDDHDDHDGGNDNDDHGNDNHGNNNHGNNNHGNNDHGNNNHGNNNHGNNDD